MWKYILIVVIAGAVFVGCTPSTGFSDSNDSNDTSTINSSAVSSAVNAVNPANFDKFLSEEQAVVGLSYDNQADDWKYTAVISLPTPCHDYEWEKNVAESFPEQVTFNLKIINPQPDVLCAQVIEVKQEQGSLQVNENATFDLSVTQE